MTNGLRGPLAAWLPAQRWFAGSAADLGDVRIAAQTPLASGDPELRHLMVDVQINGATVSYQVLAGLRSELPPALCGAAIGPDGNGRIAYDALSDPELTAVLLRGIAGQRTEGALRFGAEPGAAIDTAVPGRAMSAEQSNTSIVFGDQAILKVLRRPFQGRHPDLEVPVALARNGSKLVAAPLGWIESDQDSWQTGGTSGAGEPTVLAILSRFCTGAQDGWSLALASVAQTASSFATEAVPSFATEAGQLGAATARLHQEMANAFGTGQLGPDGLAELAAGMSAELDQALPEVPELDEHAPAIRACYAELAAQAGPVTVQRIHGDYHLGQVLGTPDGWVVLDFEGEPSVPLARRRAYAPALRDVAGMLRSFDYAARHQLVTGGPDGGGPGRAADWARSCEEAFCAGYAAAGGGDPLGSGPLLRALIYAKAVYEAVYEARHRPGWLSIPLTAIAEAGS